MSGTKQAIETMEISRRVRLLRMVGAGLAAGGLSAAVFAADTAGAATSTVVTTTKTSQYGTILVSGKTVYILKSASKVACTAQCLKIWPAPSVQGGDKAHRRTGSERGEPRHSEAQEWVTPGDVRRQASLLVHRGHRSGSGAREHHRQMGRVVRRRDREAGPCQLWIRRDADDERGIGRSLFLVPRRTRAPRLTNGPWS